MFLIITRIPFEVLEKTTQTTETTTTGGNYEIDEHRR